MPPAGFQSRSLACEASDFPLTYQVVLHFQVRCVYFIFFFCSLISVINFYQNIFWVIRLLGYMNLRRKNKHTVFKWIRYIFLLNKLLWEDIENISYNTLNFEIFEDLGNILSDNSFFYHVHKTFFFHFSKFSYHLQFFFHFRSFASFWQCYYPMRPTIIAVKKKKWING